MGYKYIFYFLLLSALLIVSVRAKSQTQNQACQGSLGDPVLTYDFARGSDQYGVSIPSKTNYKYVEHQPEDGEYTIVKTTAGMGHVVAGNWLLVTNHTINDPDGYMMLINADDKQAGIFYQEEISGLCPGTTYEFAAWIINLIARSGIKPNLKFTIESVTGSILKEFDTGEIPEGSNTAWKRYAGTFRTTDDKVIVKIKNNGLGGGGNDFALDDITFRACGPVIIPSIDGKVGPEQDLCVNLKKDITFSTEVSPGVYLNPQYLWQEKGLDGNWKDMPDETNDHLTKTFENQPVGVYNYRVFVAETGNINSENCRSNSPEFTINIIDPPPPVNDRNIDICMQETLNLTAVTDGSSYLWTGPQSYTSTDRSPSIASATPEMSGKYTVSVTTDAGCITTEEIEVKILPPAIAEIEPIATICKGTPVTLSAKAGGVAYRWLPETGLSDPTARAPVASPQENTTYTVYISNGICETTASITVNLFKPTSANAGPDEKIVKGNSIQLHGNGSGDNIEYLWIPSSYLDDPHKINPVATPPSDITYTLNVISKDGCATSTDELFIKVYEKLIVPNVFSPNGDGTNDTWNITAIDAYPNANVKVINRYGELIFESNNYYNKPWDGKHQNKDAPVGVYYYMISLSPGLKTLTGSIMVLR